MTHVLAGIIFVLLGVVGYLLKKVYALKLDKPSSETEERDASLKNTWNKFDELLTSLLTIHEIGIVNAGSIKKEEFYQTVLESACELIHSPRGSLMIFDDASQELRIAASKNISKEVIETTHIKPGQGIGGRAFETGETIFVTDPEQNTQYKDFIGGEEQKEPFIALPLKVKDKPFGVLNLHLSREKESFTDYDLKFLTLLAGESAITLENIKLYESIENFYLEMVQTLARVIDAKDAYTGDHAGRARQKARSLAEELHMPEQMIKYVEYAALLHDIGKIGIDGGILSKPGRLTEAEYTEIKKHPAIGYQILSPIHFLGPVAQMVLYHQEWYNGMGYPEGLKGEEIPLGARIVATIDAWDAMMSDRPYRKALSREIGVSELTKGAGKQFDPQVVEAFLKLENKEWQGPK
ncbi:MAG: HD-GYP domain-containing protein [Elusimicrobiales bacterium]|jgi:HD-GYP domain-containing protein (c-di-GMP phosphodiesterase class II)